MLLISNSLKRSQTYLADIAAERARIARELHDGIAQNLAAIGYSLDAEIGRSDTTTDSRTALRSIREEITSLNATMREEIFKLRKAIELSPQNELIETLQSLRVDFSLEGELIEGEIGAAHCKVLIELARNAISHAKAHEIKIDIFPRQISFTSLGDVTSEASPGGFGLQGVVERLAEFGWEIEISEDFSEITLMEVK